MSQQEFVLPIRVYYEDTDVAGVVYYANYLKFYERGRTEWLRSLGWEQDILIEQNLAFAVAKVEIHYKLPARFNDQLLVKTKISQARRSSIVFEQQIVKDDAQQTVLNSATIKVACVNMADMTPTAMPKYLQEEIASAWC